jgi:hypothetical protein
MNPEIRAGIDRAKANLDKLAQALDRIATDPEIRVRLGTQPLETLSELGFELDDKTRGEILEQLIIDRTSGEALPGFPSASMVKSGVKSGVKVGVSTGVTTAVKSGVQSGVEATVVAIIAAETPEGTPGPAEKPEPKPGKE